MDHSDRKTSSPISATSISSTISNSTNTQPNVTTELSNQPVTASSSTKSPANNNANIQRPRPTPYHDKHLKEFSLHQFDRNLTIEKATFEPLHQSHVPSPPPQQQQPRTVPSPQQDPPTAVNKPNTLDSTLVDTAAQPPSTAEKPSQHDTFTTLSPTKIPEKTLTTTKRYDAIPHSPPRATLASNKTQPPMKNEVEKQYNKKKNRKPQGNNGAATPSEVFHRNLVDAVSNVEESDEHEQYVYPYSHHDPSSGSATAAYSTRSSKQKNRHSHRRVNSPLIASAPGSSLSLHQPRSSPAQSQQNSTGSLLRYSTDKRQHSPPLSPQQQQQRQQDSYRYGTKYQQPSVMSPALSPMVDEERGTWTKRNYHRPKLRSHVMDHNALPQPWSHEVSSSDDEDDDEVDDDDNYRQSPDSERMYLLRRAQRHRPQSSMSCAKVLRNTCISILVFTIMIMILTVYRAEPLTDVSASMEHVLASDKELIFDLMVRANNWNWWQIRIQQADLSVFAFSQLEPLGVDPAEYIGSFQSFDQPLSFTSSAILGPHQLANASAQIRIKSPGADPSGNQRWSRMIRYPFGLVIRGVLNYRPLPLFNLSSRQSIPLCIVTNIDPITHASPSSSHFSYTDSDHGYCSHYPPVSPIL